MRFSLLVPPLLLVLLVLPLGCGPKAPSLVPVSGQVMMNNQPLAKAFVRFQPANRAADPSLSPDSFGETDDNGNYTLKPVRGRSGVEGAVAGEHYVQISIFDRVGDGTSGPRELVPFRYNRQSTLTFTVPAGGTKEANFKLTSP